MKTKLLLLLFLFAFKLTTFAQNKVIKYCEVLIYRNGFNTIGKVKISTGKVDSLFSIKDNNLKIELQKVDILKTVPDVLNYMSSIGWSLVTLATTGDYTLYFKREFDPSELSTTSNH